MTKWVIFLVAFLSSPVLLANSRLPSVAAVEGHLRAVRTLDLNRFLGTWYEIASSPESYPKNCGGGIAQYNLTANGKIQMLSICRKMQSGQIVETSSVAEISDHDSNSKMRISYMPTWARWTGFGQGHLWVVDLASDYSYAVISEPGGHFVRVLSRTPSISKDTYDLISQHLLAQDLDPERLISSRPNSVTAR